MISRLSDNILQVTGIESSCTKKHFRYNVLGAGISFLCLIHCLLTPLIVGYISLTHEVWHGLDFLFLGLAFVLILIVSFRTQKWWIKTGLWLGISLLVTGLVFHHSHDPSWLVYSGSFLLIVFHSLNLTNRSCKASSVNT